MRDVRQRQIIKVGLFEQSGGWVFVVTDKEFYEIPLASGKRKTLALAMDAARAAAPRDRPIVFSRIDNLSDDWIM
jgi:hypothetical protein